MSIRLYCSSPEERLALSDLAKDWPVGQFWAYEEIIVSLKIPQTFLVYFEQGGQWVAMALGRLFADELELFYIYVRSSHRRKGYAGQILQAFTSEVSKHTAVEKILLEVRASNLPAQQLYDRFGFQKVAERKKYYADGEDAWIYVKNLGN